MADPGDAYTKEQIDDALTALVAYAGNANGAVKYLRSIGKRAPAGTTLSNWARVVHWERYEELREKLDEKLEGVLANNYLDAARFATETTMLAVEQAKKRLEAGEDQDPGRTAANLSRVAQTTTEKRLALQGRPEKITENRDIGAILRSLDAKGVIKLPAQPAQLEEKT